MQLPGVFQNAAAGSPKEEIPLAEAPVPLPQTWGPAAPPVLWLWGWDLLPKASEPKPVLPQSTLGIDKSAGEGLGADA